MYINLNNDLVLMYVLKRYEKKNIELFFLKWCCFNGMRFYIEMRDNMSLGNFIGIFYVVN